MAAATERPSCDEVLSACLVYTQVLEKEGQTLYVVIKAKEERIAELEADRAEYPGWFWAVLGLAAGSLAVGVIK